MQDAINKWQLPSTAERYLWVEGGTLGSAPKHGKPMSELKLSEPILGL